MKSILRNKVVSAALLLVAGLVLSACGQTSTDPDPTSILSLRTSGLEQLDNGFHYEGWAIVDGSPVTTGKFNIDSDGNIVDLDGKAQSEFTVTSDISAATDIVITIEPNGDTDTIPATTKVLGGALSSGASSLSASHPAALGDAFTDAAGKFILATPTDGANDTNEFSGVWFLDNSSGSAVAGLDLPALPEGWAYEGWAVIDGQPVTTGRFTALAGADDFGGFSGSAGGPPFPGEDFLNNAPSGVTFPTDLRGNTIVISIEPDADDSPAPFAFKPLVGSAPVDGTDHVAYSLGLNLASFPVASATVVYGTDPAPVAPAAPSAATNPPVSTLTLQTSGLERLDNGFHYEGWAIVDGSPVTTGKFNIDSEGNIVDLHGAKLADFTLRSDISGASDIVITIEPDGDTDTIPATTKVLGGALSSGASSLTAAHPAALGNDFSSAAGKFILATPTDGANDTNEFSGVWFLDNSSGSAVAGLDLPELPEGWAYEGWAVIDGQPVTTGRFTALAGADDFGGFSGSASGPPFPGEDFLNNAPSGVTFPTDLRGNTIVISIEPDADDSPAPFAFKPLLGSAPADGADHAAFDLGQNLGSFPTATATVVYK